MEPIIKIRNEYNYKVCKVGISDNVTNRVSSLNKTWKQVGVAFKLIKVSSLLDSAHKLEQSIHYILEQQNMDFITKQKLDGSTELFYYQDWYPNMIPSL